MGYNKMDNEAKKMFEEILKSMYMPCDCDIYVKIKDKPTEKTEPKEVKEPEFKVGDVVVLKSGGCDMTIDGIDNKNNLVHCAYMNYTSKVEWVTLSKNAIKKVKHVI